jgi:hypothetical protein
MDRFILAIAAWFAIVYSAQAQDDTLLIRAKALENSMATVQKDIASMKASLAQIQSDMAGLKAAAKEGGANGYLAKTDQPKTDKVAPADYVKYTIKDGVPTRDPQGIHCYYPTLGLYAPCDMDLATIYRSTPTYTYDAGSYGSVSFGGPVMGGGGCAGGGCAGGSCGGGGRGLFRRW